MSKETAINDINNKLSKEEDDIVNSILSELNESEREQQMPPQQHHQEMQHQEMPHQEMPHQQQSLQQQQMQQQQMQQQQMQQQQMQQQQMQQQQMQHPPNQDPNDLKLDTTDKTENVFDNIKKNIKEPIIIGIIAFILSLPQIDNMLVSTGFSFLIGVDNNLSMMGIAFKCLSIGIIYYMFKMFLNS